MEVAQRRLLDLLGMPDARFAIPAYQRTYSWGRDQCEELWLDILRAARQGRNHFIGTVLYLQAPAEGALRVLEVVDGQQRLTTVSIIVLALTRHLERVAADPSRAQGAGSAGEGSALGAWGERFLMVREDGRLLPKLLLSRPDRAAYAAALKGAGPVTDGRPTSRIFANLAFFEERMAEEGFDADLLMGGLDRLVAIEAKVADPRDAQPIFEGINSKGMPLNVADMVRNYLLLSESHDEQARMYEEYWQPIQGMFAPDPGSLRLDTAIKSWLAVRLKGARIRSPEQVYSSFKRFVEDAYQGAKEPILRELRGFSLMWAESYRYHGVKKYKSGREWAEIGAPTLTAGYKLKKPDNEAYAARVREELSRVDERW